MGARALWKREVAGSSPVFPTNFKILSAMELGYRAFNAANRVRTPAGLPISIPG